MAQFGCRTQLECRQAGRQSALVLSPPSRIRARCMCSWPITRWCRAARVARAGLPIAQKPLRCRRAGGPDGAGCCMVTVNSYLAADPQQHRAAGEASSGRRICGGCGRRGAAGDGQKPAKLQFRRDPERRARGARSAISNGASMNTFCLQGGAMLEHITLRAPMSRRVRAQFHPGAGAMSSDAGGLACLRTTFFEEEGKPGFLTANPARGRYGDRSLGGSRCRACHLA